MDALLAADEARYAGAGGMEEEGCVAMQYVKPAAGGGVMSSRALAAAQEIVGDDEEDEDLA